MDDWITSHEAMQLLGPKSREAAERWAEAIVTRVGHGLMPVRASAFIHGSERRAGDHPEVDGCLFRAYNLEQNWVTGDFSAEPNPFAKEPISFKAFGVQFRRSDIEALVPQGGILQFPTANNISPQVRALLDPQQDNKSKEKEPASGAKVRVLQWEQFAAALAVLFDRGDIDHSSENATHKSVADFLASKGHDNTLGIDTVRPLIRRFNAWRHRHDYVDDVAAGDD